MRVVMLNIITNKYMCNGVAVDAFNIIVSHTISIIHRFSNIIMYIVISVSFFIFHTIYYK